MRASRAAAERVTMRMVSSPAMVPSTSGELLLVDRLGDRLGAAGDRMEDDELADPVDPGEQLR